MKESLESAQNIHQIIIVICTIVVIFAISIIPKPNPYEWAINDILTVEDTIVKLVQANELRLEYGENFKVYPKQTIISSKVEDSLINLVESNNNTVRYNISIISENEKLIEENLETARNNLIYTEAMRDTIAKDSVRRNTETFDSLVSAARREYLKTLKTQLIVIPSISKKAFINE
jgi:hypothetical protein